MCWVALSESGTWCRPRAPGRGSCRPVAPHGRSPVTLRTRAPSRARLRHSKDGHQAGEGLTLTCGGSASASRVMARRSSSVNRGLLVRRRGTAMTTRSNSPRHRTMSSCPRVMGAKVAGVDGDDGRILGRNPPARGRSGHWAMARLCGNPAAPAGGRAPPRPSGGGARPGRASTPRHPQRWGFQVDETTAARRDMTASDADASGAAPARTADQAAPDRRLAGASTRLTATPSPPCTRGSGANHLERWVGQQTASSSMSSVGARG